MKIVEIELEVFVVVGSVMVVDVLEVVDVTVVIVVALEVVVVNNVVDKDEIVVLKANLSSVCLAYFALHLYWPDHNHAS